MTHPDKAEEAFSLYLMNGDFKPAMISWAVDLLCAGGGGESTTLLAGADHEDDHTVISLFLKAATEHEVELPGEDADFVVVERWWCRRVASGKMEPLDGLTQLYKGWIASGFDRRFYRWMRLSDSVGLMEEGIWGGIEPFEKMTSETVNKTILDEVRKVVDEAARGDTAMRPLQG